MMSPTWYDLLDLEPTATTDEIRAAWKAAIAELDPTDRRFRTLSEAAAVLLDADKRAAYDAELAAHAEALTEADEADEDEAGEEDRTRAEAQQDAERAGETEEEADGPAEAEEPAAAPSRHYRPVPRWVLGAVGLLAVAALVAAVVTITRGGTEVVTYANNSSTTSTLDDNYGAKITRSHTLMSEAPARDALAAARAAVPPIFSYDYRHMDAAQQKAHAYMTSSYRTEYDKVFAVLKDNVANTKTVVKALAPVDAGVVRVSKDRVQVLVLFDQPTTNAKTTKPLPYQSSATLSMVQQDGKWLVDDVVTKPAS